eukprot:7705178-Pyramimonas_sp.AAC.1
MSDDGSLVRGVYGPLPAMHQQSSGAAEHAGLAVAILRRNVGSADHAASSIRVDYSGLFAGVRNASR